MNAQSESPSEGGRGRRLLSPRWLTLLFLAVAAVPLVVLAIRSTEGGNPAARPGGLADRGPIARAVDPLSLPDAPPDPPPELRRSPDRAPAAPVVRPPGRSPARHPSTGALEIRFARGQQPWTEPVAVRLLPPLETGVPPSLAVSVDGAVGFEELPPAAGYRYELTEDPPAVLQPADPAVEFREDGALMPRMHQRGRSGEFQIEAGQTRVLEVSMLGAAYVRGRLIDLVDDGSRGFVTIRTEQVHANPHDSQNNFTAFAVDRTATADEWGHFFAEVWPGRKKVEATWYTPGADYFVWTSEFRELGPGEVWDLGDIRVSIDTSQEFVARFRDEGGQHLPAELVCEGPARLEVILTAIAERDVDSREVRCDFVPGVEVDRPFRIHGLASGVRYQLLTDLGLEPGGVRPRPPYSILWEGAVELVFRAGTHTAEPLEIAIEAAGTCATRLEAHVDPAGDGPGEPVAPRAYLRGYLVNIYTARAFAVSLDPPPHARAGLAGETLEALPPGRYRAFLHTPEPASDGRSYWFGGELEVPHLDEGVIVLQLERAGRREGEARGDDGEPWTGLVQLAPAELALRDDPLWLFKAQPRDGHFELCGVPEGLELHAWSMAGGPRIRWRKP